MAETRPSNDDRPHRRDAGLQALPRARTGRARFEDYLADRPRAARRSRATRTSALYDMIISYGTEEYIDNKKKLVRYNFFKDEQTAGANAIFGLDIPLMRLVHVLKAAAEGYGPEKRVILLHGPVGSSQEHDRAPPQEGHRALLAHARRRALHVRLGEPRRRRASPATRATASPAR